MCVENINSKNMIKS